MTADTPAPEPLGQRAESDPRLSDHRHIFLEPKCCADPREGRLWCQDNVWPSGDCDVQAEATQYVRADLVAALELERDAALARAERLEVALSFYANPDNWRDTPSWDGDPDCITPKAIPVDHAQDGSPCDCGDIARAALATEPPT